ncbi:hypothetical protein BpHYR1_042634 [Brachionus plicatilis]|uniref:Uncharacterized protein n=1 Tax=Brachionus plicatilis TaxID=10195 RepID=A0A3M7T7N5_BRAPC|nr:hypothetical protein BpHYR1_042634 [Brachionus plicatilis]
MFLIKDRALLLTQATKSWQSGTGLSHGSSPASMATRTMPHDQMSVGVALYSFLLKTSGATYGAVPHGEFSSLSLPLYWNKVAKPKSAILIWSKSLRSKFSGLMSRCTIPFACKYSTPLISWTKYV